MRAGPLDMLPLSDELGLELIDVARALDQPLLVPMRLDLAALRADAAAGVLPSILSDLVARPRIATAGRRRRRLAARWRGRGGGRGGDRDRIVVEFVRTHTSRRCSATSPPESIEADRPFKELGFDSLSAVELRNRLAKASGRDAAGDAGVRSSDADRGGGAVARDRRGRKQRDAACVRAVAASMSRSRSWGWRAAIRVGCVRRRICGIWSTSGRDAIGEFPSDRGWDRGAVVRSGCQPAGHDLHASRRVRV